MRLKRRSAVLLSLAMILANSAGVLAQDGSKDKKVVTDIVIQGRDGVFIADGPGGPPGPGMAFWQQGEGAFFIVDSEMTFDAKIVKGAPYSAQVSTESIQTLADGNRIVHSSTGSIYRDSEGRTRRDQSIGLMGSWRSSGDRQPTYMINDPVAGVSYVLIPGEKIARKIPRMQGKPDLSVEVLPRRQQMKTTDGADANVKVVQPKKESLGAQVMEGVQAEGTRTTVTISAGDMGNEMPIYIVSERWYSPELQVVVLSKHSDPRFGETTYRLTNINRSEPSPSLFEVPSDYTVKEGPPRGEFRIRQRRPSTQF
jgi:hypothetical protein